MTDATVDLDRISCIRLDLSRKLLLFRVHLCFGMPWGCLGHECLVYLLLTRMLNPYQLFYFTCDLGVVLVLLTSSPSKQNGSV